MENLWGLQPRPPASLLQSRGNYTTGLMVSFCLEMQGMTEKPLLCKGVALEASPAHSSVLRQQLHLSLHTAGVAGSTWSMVQARKINPGI